MHRQGPVPEAWNPDFQISLAKQLQIVRFERGGVSKGWGKVKDQNLHVLRDNMTKQITPKPQRMSQWLEPFPEVIAAQASSMEPFFLSPQCFCVFVRKSLSHMGAGRGHWAQTGCNCCPGTLDGETPLGIEEVRGCVTILTGKNTGRKVPSTHHYWCCWL